MNTEKKVLKRSAMLLLMASTIGFTNTYAQAPAQAGAKAPIQGPRVYFRAPDVIPGTLPEMRTVDYWVGKMQSPDEVVMPLSKIQAMNAAYWQRMKNLPSVDSDLVRLITRKLESNPGLYTANPDLYNKTGAEVSAITKAMVAKDARYLRRGKFGNLLAVEYSAKELDAMEAEINAAKIDADVKVQPGIMVTDSRLRIVPEISPEYTGSNDKGKGRWDMWNLDAVAIGSPVQILHASRSGAWVFICSANGYGWVNSSDVAMGDRKTTEQFSQGAAFVVATGDIVPFYTDATCKYASGVFRMGTKLPTVAGNARQIQVPVRLANGKLAVQQAWLAADADVHKGYLPYTRKNIVVQEMKLLDNIYDWTGGWLGRNHATNLRAIYATFGFTLPGCGELMSAFNDKVSRVRAKAGKDAEYKAILANDPFTTLQICSSGHSQIFMGNYDGTPISYDNNGYGYVDENNREVEIRRTAIVPISIPNYFLREDIIFVSLK